MYSLLTILIVILAVVLVLIVLVQNSKGGGLAANFASSNQIMGVRKTTDFLEKTTWGLIISIVVLCIMATAFHETDASQGQEFTSVVTNTPAEQAAPTTAGQFDDAAAAGQIAMDPEAAAPIAE